MGTGVDYDQVGDLMNLMRKAVPVCAHVPPAAAWPEAPLPPPCRGSGGPLYSPGCLQGENLNPQNRLFDTEKLRLGQPPSPQLHSQYV